ncbi:type 2 isopentenyl-diphosphate Delta-isomerase [Lottiidibacillus patelloidae]|uniref:Isopentenyl-diphosphate delta-isomerase n=1 Tax=Lottiidibacillus patelloidae TaxID=2670334 RepID=A0A263BUL1_9BACI|nr:type 2 isopentenyl-diphosphate Delta-isomerase [Lottiidibacillus patelloidae]OZM57258.1 type 2 isopentenyl-diphosphate Delta-isomerase [Lottiidibacillus patelloidae]
MSRSKRKLEHINYAISTGQKRTHGLDDISFVHNSLPGIALQDVSLRTKIGELSISSPIFINAMTGGGGEKTEKINALLAEVAKICDLPIAVGSQMAAIKDISQSRSFEIVRKVHKNGIVFANIGSEASVEQAQKAVDMIDANALQIHLNVIQELVMPEGDRDFTGVLNRIEAIVNKLTVPVIVKEVGFGMSKQTVSKLKGIGVSIVDVGGFGGTNFATVENQRRSKQLEQFNDWGIPTSVSIGEAKASSPSISILASGGIQTSSEIAKAVSLGASAVGVAGYFLKILLEDGQEALINEIQHMQDGLKIIMTALGTKSVNELQNAPIVIRGETLSWFEQRAINIQNLAQKK